jgi:hypothetical protein
VTAKVQSDPSTGKETQMSGSKKSGRQTYPYTFWKKICLEKRP